QQYDLAQVLISIHCSFLHRVSGTKVFIWSPGAARASLDGSAGIWPSMIFIKISQLSSLITQGIPLIISLANMRGGCVTGKRKTPQGMKKCGSLFKIAYAT